MLRRLPDITWGEHAHFSGVLCREYMPHQYSQGGYVDQVFSCRILLQVAGVLLMIYTWLSPRRQHDAGSDSSAGVEIFTVASASSCGGSGGGCASDRRNAE